MSDSLILDDRSLADTLVLAEEAIGKRSTIRSDFEYAIRELIEIDVLATQTFSHLRSVSRETFTRCRSSSASAASFGPES